MPKGDQWAAGMGLDPDKDDPFKGTLALVSQGCTYYAVLVTNGPYRGRVVYIDHNLCGPPYFVRNVDFVSWYERWVDGLLWGYSDFWFGFGLPGRETDLTAALEGSTYSSELPDRGDPAVWDVWQPLSGGRLTPLCGGPPRRIRRRFVQVPFACWRSTASRPPLPASRRCSMNGTHWFGNAAIPALAPVLPGARLGTGGTDGQLRRFRSRQSCASASGGSTSRDGRRSSKSGTSNRCSNPLRSSPSAARAALGDRLCRLMLVVRHNLQQASWTIRTPQRAPVRDLWCCRSDASTVTTAPGSGRKDPELVGKSRCRTGAAWVHRRTVAHPD